VQTFDSRGLADRVVPQADLMLQFRKLFVEQPELVSSLNSARDLDAVAEALDRVGARYGIATSAAEIRGYVRRLQKDYRADGELSSDQLDGISAGASAGEDLALMFACLGLNPGVPR